MWEPYQLLDPEGSVVEPVAMYLKDLMAADSSPLTPRSYGMDLLRWWRFLLCTMSSGTSCRRDLVPSWPQPRLQREHPSQVKSRAPASQRLGSLGAAAAGCGGTRGLVRCDAAALVDGRRRGSP